MHIQPYFPEPVEVGGNAASERYGVTLRFIRSTMAGHALSAGAVAGVVVLQAPAVSFELAGYVFLGCLLVLTIVRRVLDGGALDNVLSLCVLAPTVWSLGTMLRLASDSGSPVWILGAGYLLASLYGVFCGRDFSFVGQLVLTTIVLTMIILTTTAFFGLAWAHAALWGLAAVAYVTYYVYDLAALLSRRRLGEAPAAVADLYRDLLNFITYTVRIVLHWRRFRFI
ncbi:MAG: hypothetical protein IH945_07510 [Armatimonadetes bacterium]|nr:hypothetical protein [Armatimonadota bacterium]